MSSSPSASPTLTPTAPTSAPAQGTPHNVLGQGGFGQLLLRAMVASERDPYHARLAVLDVFFKLISG